MRGLESSWAGQRSVVVRWAMRWIGGWAVRLRTPRRLAFWLGSRLPCFDSSKMSPKHRTELRAEPDRDSTQIFNPLVTDWFIAGSSFHRSSHRHMARTIPSFPNSPRLLSPSKECHELTTTKIVQFGGTPIAENLDATATKIDTELKSDVIAWLFLRVAVRLFVVWATGLVVLMAALAWIGQSMPAIQSMPKISGQWTMVILISIASGLVSLAALVPGWLIGKSVANDKSVLTGVATVGVSAALAIRFTGTVALFVACRYHFGVEATGWIAFLVIGWYVLLTIVEVQQLAKGLTSLDRKPARP